MAKRGYGQLTWTFKCLKKRVDGCRYQQVNASVAKQMWVEAHTSSNRQHGNGNRLRELHLLSGLVLPIWPQIESCLSQQLKASQRRFNVMRLETTGAPKPIAPFLNVSLHWECKAWQCYKTTGSAPLLPFGSLINTFYGDMSEEMSIPIITPTEMPKNDLQRHCWMEDAFSRQSQLL